MNHQYLLLNVSLPETTKKRKYESELYSKISQIIEINPVSKEWLIEWDNKTRTWEKYDDLKNLHSFREYIETKLTRTKKIIPEYIL